MVHSSTVRGYFFDRVPPYGYAIFRLCLGFFAAFKYTRSFSGWIHIFKDPLEAAVDRAMPYPYFYWVHPLMSKAVDTFPFIDGHLNDIILVSGILLMLGIGTRPAAFVCALIYWMSFFVSGATEFVNHYYFKAMILTVLALTPDTTGLTLPSLAKAAYQKFRGQKRPWIDFPQKHYAPRIAVNVIRYLFCVVLFFGGLNKIQDDWLRGQPFRIYIEKGYRDRFITRWLLDQFQIFSVTGFALFLSYGGILYDSLSPLLLIYFTYYPPNFWTGKRVIPWMALVGTTVFFHITNAYLLGHIGQFPWMMLTGSTIFLPGDWPLSVWAYVTDGLRACGILQVDSDLRQETHAPSKTAGDSRSQSGKKLSIREILVITACLVFVAHQAANPCRKIFNDENVLWNVDKSYFGWHMMMMTRRTWMASFVVTDRATNTTQAVIPLNEFRSASQQNLNTKLTVEEFWSSAGRLSHVAKILELRMRVKGAMPMRVFGKIQVEFNGRPIQDALQPGIDLVEVDSYSSDIMRRLQPLNEELLKELNPFYVASKDPEYLQKWIA